MTVDCLPQKCELINVLDMHYLINYVAPTLLPTLVYEMLLPSKVEIYQLFHPHHNYTDTPRITPMIDPIACGTRSSIPVVCFAPAFRL